MTAPDDEQRKLEDCLIRQIMESPPPYLDLDDPNYIAFNLKELRWMNAREVIEYDNTK